LVEKCGYWDESFHVPLVVRDPSAAANGTRGLVVEAPTESVDVAPTVLEWLGGDLPAQFDGWPLTSFLHAGAMPAHWRTTVHWEWDFRHPQYRYAEQRLGIPGEHCSLVVARTAEAKYVQFAASPDVLPSLLFDLAADPSHRVNLATGPGGAVPEAAAHGADLRLELQMAQEMLRWRMRNMERTFTNCYLAPGTGPVWARDEWR
jgi:arylsulfatase A-like enzyme